MVINLHHVITTAKVGEQNIIGTAEFPGYPLPIAFTFVSPEVTTILSFVIAVFLYLSFNHLVCAFLNNVDVFCLF